MGEIGPLRLDVPIRPPQARAGAVDGGSFAQTLKGFLSDVNALQLRAGQMNEAYARGEVRDLHEVVVAQQEAAVSMRLLLQMRDRVISAYQEIMRMPV